MIQAVLDSADQANSLMEGLFAWASLQMATLDTPLVDVGNVARITVEGAKAAASDKGLAFQAC